MKVFLSHISQEAQIAQKIKEHLEHALRGAEIFVSEVDVEPGKPWLKAISDSLADAKVVLVLCSHQSIKRPWVNFESGAGWRGS